MNDDKVKQQAASGIAASLENAKRNNATANLPTDVGGVLSTGADLVRDPRDADVAAYLKFNRQFDTGSLLEPERRIISTTMGVHPDLIAGAGGLSPQDAARRAAETLGGLGDQSVGVQMPEDMGSETQRRVATSVRMTGAGPKDYKQYEYPVDDNRGAVEGGETLDALHQQQSFLSGTTRASQVRGQFRSMDGKQGNPYYLATASSPVYTQVAPFKVQIPEFGLEVTSETTDPEKLAFDISTVIQGVPRERFIGYKKVPEIKESFTSAFIKGKENIPEMIGTSIFGAANAAGMLMGSIFYDSESTLAASKELDQWWNKNFRQKYYEFANSEVFGDNIAAKIGYSIPGAAASFAMIAAANALMGVGGTIGAAALLNAGEAVDIAIRAQEHGVSPQGAVWLGTIGGGMITAFDSIGVRKGHLTLKAAIGDTVDKLVKQSTGKRMAGSVLRYLGDSALEGTTEWAQTGIAQLLSLDLFDGDKLADNLTDQGVSALVGFMMRAVAFPMDIKRARAEGMLERVVKGEVKDSASELEKSFNSAVDALVEGGIKDRGAAAEAALYLASDEGRGKLRRFIQDAMAGELDKIDQNTIEGMRRLPQWLKDMAGESFKSLDAAVLAQIGDGFTDQQKTMITRAMRGIVSVIGAYRGGEAQPELPTFRIGEAAEFRGRNRNALGFYSPGKNEIVLHPNAVAESGDLNLVSPEAGLSPIAYRDRTLLHEMGHYLDYQMGIKGPGFKEFLPAYFGAIAKVYGEAQARAVQSAYERSVNKSRNLDFKRGIKYMDTRDTKEWFGHAVGRLGRQIGEAMGLQGDVADYINVANIMGRQLLLPSIQESLTALRKTIDATIKQNADVLSKMTKAHGEDALAQKIQDYIAGDTTALTAEEVQGLYKMLTTFVGSNELQILKEAMPGQTKESFMERTQREFQQAVDEGAKNADTAVSGGKPEGTTEGTATGTEGGAETPAGADPTLPTRNYGDQALPGTVVEDRATAALSSGNGTEVMNAEGVMQSVGKQRVRGDLKERIRRSLWGRNYEQDAELASAAIDGVKAMPKWFSRLMGGRSMSSLDDFLWLFGGSKLGEQFQLAKLANRQTSLAFERREAFIKSLVGEGKLFKSNYEMDVFVNKLREKNIKVEGLVDQATGQIMDTVYTDADHAINVYLHNKNSNTRARVLQAFNGNAAAMQAVIDQLTPEQKAYADAMQADVAKHWDTYMRSYNEEGIDMDDTEPYWPAVAALRAMIGDRAPNTAYSRDLTKQYAMDVLTVGASELFNNHINRVAGAQSLFYRTLMRIKDLFGYEPSHTTLESDPENQSAEALAYRTSQALRTKLASKYGPEALQNFNNLVDDFIKQRDGKTVGDSAINVISRNVITNLFMFKPIQLVKNFANATGWWGLAENQQQYWANLGYATTHIKEATKYMLDASTILRERWAGKGLDEQLGASAATGGDSLLFRWATKKSNLKPGVMQMMSNYQAMTKRLTQAGLSPMLAGDLMANVIGGYPILKELEIKYGDKKRAVEEFEVMLSRHQSSTNQAMRSLMQREWNRDVRGQLIALTSETATKGKSQIRSIADVFRGERTVGSALKENVSTLMSIVMFSLLAAGIWDLFDDDEANDQAVYDALVAEGFNNLLGVNPLGSAFINPLVTGIFTDYDRQLSTPLTAAVAKDMNSLSKGEWRDIVTDAASASGFLMGAPQMMNSLEGLMRIAAPKQEGDVKAGILQLSGKSRSSSERSAGIKKKVEKKDDED